MQLIIDINHSHRLQAYLLLLFTAHLLESELLLEEESVLEVVLNRIELLHRFLDGFYRSVGNKHTKAGI